MTISKQVLRSVSVIKAGWFLCLTHLTKSPSQYSGTLRSLTSFSLCSIELTKCLRLGWYPWLWCLCWRLLSFIGRSILLMLSSCMIDRWRTGARITGPSSFKSTNKFVDTVGIKLCFECAGKQVQEESIMLQRVTLITLRALLFVMDLSCVIEVTLIALVIIVKMPDAVALYFATHAWWFWLSG